MRVPPPGLLKLDRGTLLRDLRARLAEHYPDYANESDLDATDPAWILLEQSAWLVELLSDQLDRYPFSVVQQFVHMLGGSLLPAHPAVGVVVVRAESPGTMSQHSDRPAPWRFFTIQTEDVDLIEFVPVERSTDIRNARVQSIAEFLDGELFVLGGKPTANGLSMQECWVQSPRRAQLFGGERIRYEILCNNAEDVSQTLNAAIEALNKRKLGWLALNVEQRGADRVVLHAEIDLSGAFAETVPGGLTDGNDVMGQWGTLDDSNWTPPVRVSSNGRLPPMLRGSTPLPGLRNGTIVIPGVPENVQVQHLLERKAAPIPTGVVKAIWSTLTHMDQTLANLTPMVHRHVLPAEDPMEPQWVSSALAEGMWGTLADRARQTYIHIDISEQEPHAGNVRVAMVLRGGSEHSEDDFRVFGVDSEGSLSRVQLNHKVAWHLRLPDPMGGRRLVMVKAVDIAVSDSHQAVLIATELKPQAVLLNAILVANAPVVNDGREMVINRNIPESISLLYEDIISAPVMQHLLEHGIPKDAADIIAALPLSSMPVSGEKPIRDFEGVSLDPVEGQMMVNAADHDGYQRVLRPKDVVSLEWYRRTDGVRGDIGVGLIELVEQPPRCHPALSAVRNPLATFFGSAREQEQEAIDRLFTPGGGVPVLPSDWERLIRVSLGARGRGWVVRCWSHAERALISNALWPLEMDGNTGAEVEAELLALRESLANAGPETLLVVLGPTSGDMSMQTLDWARQVVGGLVRHHRKRLPVVRKAIVARFWPLTAVMETAPNDLPIPCFSITDLAESCGTGAPQLQDVHNHRAPMPTTRLLLNAAVLNTVVTQ